MATDFTKCIAVPGESHIIDALRDDGRTCVYGKTIDEVQREHPDAQVYDFDEWLKQKAERQNTPVQWTEITCEQFNDSLCVLPPATRTEFGFLIGEPDDHCASTGLPRFRAFGRIVSDESEHYFTSSRPMTVIEFKTAAFARPKVDQLSQ